MARRLTTVLQRFCKSLFHTYGSIKYGILNVPILLQKKRIPGSQGKRCNSVLRCQAWHHHVLLLLHQQGAWKSYLSVRVKIWPEKQAGETARSFFLSSGKIHALSMLFGALNWTSQPKGVALSAVPDDSHFKLFVLQWIIDSLPHDVVIC